MKHEIKRSIHIEKGPFLIPPRRQRSNQIHRIFSIKAGMRIVLVESPVEAEAIYWAEANPDITKLCEQPLRVHIQYGNSNYYTFDLSVRFKSGKEIYYEIKPESSLKVDESGVKKPANWSVIESWCEANGFVGEVLTTNELKPYKVTIANWRRILPFARVSYDYPNILYENELKQFFQDIKKIKILGVLKQFSAQDPDVTVNCIAKFLHLGILDSDINTKPFCIHTTLRIVDGNG